MSLIAGQVYLLGCGPGGADYVTPAVYSLVQEADDIFGCERSLALFPYAKAARHIFHANFPDLVTLTLGLLGANRRVAWLVTGDVGLFSLAKSLRVALGEDRCISIPGISSVQVACARLSLDWSDLQIFSAHGRGGFAVQDLDIQRSVALLVGGSIEPEGLSALAEALSPTHLLYVCQNLTLSGEVVRCIPSEEWCSWATQPRTLFIWKRIHDDNK